MKVLHINVNYLTSPLHQVMVGHLERPGVDNYVFAPTCDSSGSVIVPKENVTVSECFKKKDRLFFRGKQRKIIDSAESLFDINDFDIIHAYTLFTDGNAAMRLSLKYGIPYVVAIRNTDVNVFFKRMIHLRSLGAEILRRAKAVFFLSPAYKRTVFSKYIPQKYLKEIETKSFVIPNGIDDFWFENRFIRDAVESCLRFRSERTLRCVCAGVIDRNKNIELTLKALTRLNNKGWNCTLTAVGRIADRRLYNRLSSYDCFRYIEPQKKEGLLPYYRGADLFIMPSHTETFGLVYPEAMSQGLPVIYTRGQGFDGQFEDGYVGYPVDDNDPGELERVIIAAVENYKELSANTGKAVCKFGWGGICSEYERIYGTAVGTARDFQ